MQKQYQYESWVVMCIMLGTGGYVPGAGWESHAITEFFERRILVIGLGAVDVVGG